MSIVGAENYSVNLIGTTKYQVVPVGEVTTQISVAIDYLLPP